MYTSDLNEANRRKYKIVAEFKEMISLAEKRLDGSLKELSKEDQIRHFALECRKLSEMNLKKLSPIFLMLLKER